MSDKPIPITLRMPRSLRDRLAKQAKAAGVSLNTWIRQCLETKDAKPCQTSKS